MRKLLQLFKKEERGMTLVELLAVIVILGIIGGIAFVSIGNIVDNSRKDAHVANAQQIISAAKLAEASGDITPEDWTDGISTDDEPLDSYIDDLVDPWTNNSVTGTVTKAGEEYSVSLGGSECNIDATESELRENGRDECIEGTGGGTGDGTGGTGNDTEEEE